MIIADSKDSDDKSISWWSLILSPLLVPIFIGIHIEEQSKSYRTTL